MEQALIDRYRCPESLVKFELIGNLSKEAGYFRFGQDTICYGRSATGFRASRADGVLYDALKDATTSGSNPVLSFDPAEIIDNLRLERYANRHNQRALNRWKRSLRNAYYFLRPLMHVNARKHVQRARLNGWRESGSSKYPPPRSRFGN